MSQNCVGLHKIPVMIRKVFPGTNLLFVFFIILIIITYFLNNNLFSFKICPGNANIGLTCIYHHYVMTSVQTLCAWFAIVPECAVQNNCLQHTHTDGHTHKTLRALGLSILFFSITHFSTSFHKSPHLSLSFQLNLLILIPTPFSLSLSLREAALVNLVGHN